MVIPLTVQNILCKFLVDRMLNLNFPHQLGSSLNRHRKTIMIFHVSLVIFRRPLCLAWSGLPLSGKRRVVRAFNNFRKSWKKVGEFKKKNFLLVKNEDHILCLCHPRSLYRRTSFTLFIWRELVIFASPTTADDSHLQVPERK